MENKEVWNLIFQITALLFTAIPAYFLFKQSPKEITTTALIIFAIILFVFIITVIYIFIYGKYKSIKIGIQSNEKGIDEIKKELNFNELMHKMDKRISVLEKLMDKINFKVSKNKKGQLQIDPRIILWLLLLFLFLLFLKSMGII